VEAGSCPPGKGVDIALLGQKEFKKTDPLVLTGRADSGFPDFREDLARGQIAATTRIAMKTIILPGRAPSARMIMILLPPMSKTRPQTLFFVWVTLAGIMIGADLENLGNVSVS
jgi:hypothetical protein